MTRTRLAALALVLAGALAAPVDARAEDAAPPAGPALSSYAEINYTRPRKASEAAFDLRRFVLGYSYGFDDATRAAAELEVEHAVSSADDKGEVEIEQAYIEHRFGATWTGRAGLVLMPAGLLNENHEPTAYFGVERNFVETAIIPSTWREGAVQAIAALESGLTVQGGISTSVDLTKWDATSEEGVESPLGAIHQEAQLARAGTLAGFAAVDWRGIPGLRLGAFAWAGGASQRQADVPRSTAALWDVHARWTPGRLDLSALYARGTFSNTAALNRPLVGTGTLIPAAFDGWYLQAGVRAWSSGNQALLPFVRYERFNTGRSYADLGPGNTPARRPTEGVFTVGVNYQLTHGVVVKADLQKFHQEDARSRFDLGLGWSL